MRRCDVKRLAKKAPRANEFTPFTATSQFESASRLPF
jgi:hypothetical protein